MDYQSPLHDAAARGDIDAIKAMLKKGKVNLNAPCQTHNNQTPLHLAAYEGKLQMAVFLLANGADVTLEDREGWTPLHCAASNLHLKLCTLLLTRGASPNAVNKQGTGPLHYIIRAPYSEELIEVLDLMVEKEANLEIANAFQETPLVQAAAKGMTESVRYLIDQGARVDAMNKFKQTALHKAVEKGSQDTVLSLLKAGADPTLRAENGLPLDIAVLERKHDIAALLQTSVLDPVLWELSTYSMFQTPAAGDTDHEPIFFRSDTRKFEEREEDNFDERQQRSAGLSLQGSSSSTGSVQGLLLASSGGHSPRPTRATSEGPSPSLERRLQSLAAPSAPPPPVSEMWYWGELSRVEAEEILRACSQSVFLLRVGSVPGCFALSQYDAESDRCAHVLIMPIEGLGYRFKESPDQTIYRTLPELIAKSPETEEFMPVGNFLPPPRKDGRPLQLPLSPAEVGAAVSMRSLMRSASAGAAAAPVPQQTTKPAPMPVPSRPPPAPPPVVVGAPTGAAPPLPATPPPTYGGSQSPLLSLSLSSSSGNAASHSPHLSTSSHHLHASGQQQLLHAPPLSSGGSRSHSARDLNFSNSSSSLSPVSSPALPTVSQLQLSVPSAGSSASLQRSEGSGGSGHGSSGNHFVGPSTPTMRLSADHSNMAALERTVRDLISGRESGLCRIDPKDVATLEPIVRTASGFKVEQAVFNVSSAAERCSLLFQACNYRNWFFNSLEHYNYVGRVNRRRSTDSFEPIVVSVLPEIDHSRYRIIIWTRLGDRQCLYTLPQILAKQTVKWRTGLPKHVVDYIRDRIVETRQRDPVELNLLLEPARLEPELNLKLLEFETYDPLRAKCFSVGVLYCRANQGTEAEHFGNEHGSSAFEEFLTFLGDKIRLKGWRGYRGDLDVKADSTGLHSIYRRWKGYEIMFHVSTMLPYTLGAEQQLHRKRRIGNDIGVIIFQEGGAYQPPIRSQFLHCYYVVQPFVPPNSPPGQTCYRFQTSYQEGVPEFGPSIPDAGIFRKSRDFRDFLLTKVMNGLLAALNHPQLREKIWCRPKEAFLTDLVKANATNKTILKSVTGQDST